MEAPRNTTPKPIDSPSTVQFRMQQKSVHPSMAPQAPGMPMSPIRPSSKKNSTKTGPRRTTKRNDRRKTMSVHPSENQLNAYRLSLEDVIPSHYTICIKPNFEEFTFEGCVSVNIKIMKETDAIVLNILDLSISKIMWEEDVTENKQEPMEFSVDPEKQIVHITFEPPLLPNDGNLRINFNGIINNRLIGLYRSKYLLHPDSVDQDTNATAPAPMTSSPTQENYHFVTKFEPTFARMCFPCWDEPMIKCTFDLSLILPLKVTGISNMPVKITYPHRSKPDLHVIEFGRTPPMSTYLLAFAIGQFEYLEMVATPEPPGRNLDIVYDRVSVVPDPESVTPAPSEYEELGVELEPGSVEEPQLPVKIRIYTAPGKKKFGEFALNTCVKLLKFYQNYFSCPFPLQKLDLVAVPEYLTHGTENWGLIMLKESRVLLNEHEHSFNSRKLVSILIANQLVHQWFGDLVTVEWWSYLWVQEGISAYMEYIAIDHLYPDYDIWKVFFTNTFLEVLAEDGLKNSHPLEMLIFHPNEIKENFDHISYDKGASILSMLKHYIGEKVFRKALSAFLQKYKFKNANSGNLWRCFELGSGKPIGAIMQSWTRRQMGYPLVRVTGVKQDENARVLTLTQEKFWADPVQRDARSVARDYIWSIPLTFSTSASPTKDVKDVLMEKKTIQVVIPNVNKSQWVKLNPEGIGYYRVKYLPEMVLQFQQSIRNRSMPPLDRVGILNDLYAFAQAGLNSILDLFNLLETYVDEDNYTVWSEIVATLDKLDRLLWDTDYYAHFRIFWRITLNTIVEKMGWQYTEDPARMKLQSLILSRMVLAHHEETLAAAEQHFLMHLSGQETVPLELRSAVYQGALIKGIQTDVLKLLLRRYKEIEALEEKECIIHAFSALSDPDLIHDVLEFAKSDAVRPSETLQIVRILANTKVGREVVWQFFRTYHNMFRMWYGQGIGYTKLVHAITENYTSEAKATEIYDFFKDKLSTTPGLERCVFQVEEKIHINTAWLQRESELIEDYLSTYE